MIRERQREGKRAWKSSKGLRTKSGNHANGDNEQKKERSSLEIMKLIF